MKENDMPNKTYYQPERNGNIPEELWDFQVFKYPEIAKENGISGRVTVQFTIDKDGSVKDVKVLRGVDSSLDKEAVRVIQKSPKWSPGKQRGKPAKVKYTFPIIFQLR